MSSIILASSTCDRGEVVQLEFEDFFKDHHLWVYTIALNKEGKYKDGVDTIILSVDLNKKTNKYCVKYKLIDSKGEYIQLEGKDEFVLCDLDRFSKNSLISILPDKYGNDITLKRIHKGDILTIFKD